MLSPRALIAASVAASALLVGAYLAAGGSAYEPTPVTDPCQPREWRSPDSVELYAEQFFLSALDGAACELGVSREELVVALPDADARAEFAAAHGISEADLEAAIRAGVVRAIDDAENAGALSPIVASGLREVATRLPIDQLLGLINDAGAAVDGVGGLLDELGL
jgi:hypothetical protein